MRRERVPPVVSSLLRAIDRDHTQGSYERYFIGEFAPTIVYVIITSMSIGILSGAFFRGEEFYLAGGRDMFIEEFYFISIQVPAVISGVTDCDEPVTFSGRDYDPHEGVFPEVFTGRVRDIYIGM